MKRTLSALLLGVLLLSGTARGAVLLDGVPVDLGETKVENNTTYIFPEQAAQALHIDSAARWGEPVPLRKLCADIGLYVAWDAHSGDIALTSANATQGLEGEDLYWLSRIISAEAQDQPWEGKIAVGNVVLNRVRSGEFPDTIYEVIFDQRWGGQFEPVRNGTVYDEPTQESILAAGACIRGASVAGESLYFLEPVLTDNHWTMENRDFVAVIGTHWFYR